MAQTADVTDQVKGLVTNNALTILVTNELMQRDPAYGAQKKLKVEYTIDDVRSSSVMLENGFLVIKAPVGKTLTVTKAVYGNLPDKNIDVTEKLAAAIKANALSIEVSNDTFEGDPCYGSPKELRVSYTVGGKPHKTTVSEPDKLVLPLEADGKGDLVIIRADYGSFK